MEHFGHFFEFIAALNSAYIVSTHFLEALADKINRELFLLHQELNGITHKQQNHFDLLVNEGPKLAHHAGETIKELNLKAISITKEISDSEVSIQNAIQKCKIAERFNVFCLFGSLYCLLILILNGWNFDFHNSYQRESFLLFNIVSLGWILILLLIKSIHLSYKKIVLVFFTSSLIFPIYWFIDWKWTVICPYNFSNLNIILSLLVPTSHFIFYFIRSVIYSRQGYKEIFPKIQNLETKVAEFGNELSIILKTLKGLTIK